ncbi:MAG: hypothetical protein ABIP51_00545 [Bacteroidia bacterium]
MSLIEKILQESSKNTFTFFAKQSEMSKEVQKLINYLKTISNYDYKIYNYITQMSIILEGANLITFFYDPYVKKNEIKKGGVFGLPGAKFDYDILLPIINKNLAEIKKEEKKNLKRKEKEEIENNKEFEKLKVQYKGPLSYDVMVALSSWKNQDNITNEVMQKIIEFSKTLDSKFKTAPKFLFRGIGLSEGEGPGMKSWSTTFSTAADFAIDQRGILDSDDAPVYIYKIETDQKRVLLNFTKLNNWIKISEKYWQDKGKSFGEYMSEAEDEIIYIQPKLTKKNLFKILGEEE